MSESKTIYAALVLAQAEMTKAKKDSENPHFRSKYADLSSVQNACLPALNRHGIAVIQPLVRNDQGLAVKTIFIHAESGETLETEVPLLVPQVITMQQLGSAMTYARRYGLMALSNIAPDDDDGNASAEAGAAPVKMIGKKRRAVLVASIFDTEAIFNDWIYRTKGAEWDSLTDQEKNGVFFWLDSHTETKDWGKKLRDALSAAIDEAKVAEPEKEGE